jgi:hypothetical protein
MTRIVARCALLLLAVCLLVGCPTTTQRNGAGITLCIASCAADVAILVARNAWVDTGGLVGWVDCEGGRSGPARIDLLFPLSSITTAPGKALLAT